MSVLLDAEGSTSAAHTSLGALLRGCLLCRCSLHTRMPPGHRFRNTHHHQKQITIIMMWLCTQVVRFLVVAAGRSDPYSDTHASGLPVHQWSCCSQKLSTVQPGMGAWRPAHAAAEYWGQGVRASDAQDADQLHKMRGSDADRAVVHCAWGPATMWQHMRSSVCGHHQHCWVPTPAPIRQDTQEAAMAVLSRRWAKFGCTCLNTLCMNSMPLLLRSTANFRHALEGLYAAVHRNSVVEREGPCGWLDCGSMPSCLLCSWYSVVRAGVRATRSRGI